MYVYVYTKKQCTVAYMYAMYCLVVKFGEGFNLSLWQICGPPNLKR